MQQQSFCLSSTTELQRKLTTTWSATMWTRTCSCWRCRIHGWRLSSSRSARTVMAEVHLRIQMMVSSLVTTSPSSSCRSLPNKRWRLRRLTRRLLCNTMSPLRELLSNLIPWIAVHFIKYCHALREQEECEIFLEKWTICADSVTLMKCAESGTLGDGI